MQAWHHHPPGGTEKLKIVQVDIPEIDDDEVLVKVHAAGLIWMELYWQLYEKEDGTYKTPIPGEDYSGVIVKVGSKVPEGLKVGTKVMVFVTKAFSSKRSTNGGMAEYAKAHFSKMVPKPLSLSHVEAASVPLSGLTAWQGLFDHAKLKAGQTLLVAGGTGPTAIWAIQIGKMVGARVIATAASEQSFKLLKSLGVDQVINYKEAKLESALASENVDVVFNAVGDEVTKQALKVVSEDGIIINIVDTTVGDLSRESVRDSFREPFFRKEEGRTVVFFIVDMNVQQLTEIGNLLDEGKLKAVIGAVYEFNDVVNAFKQGETGHAHGKIVVKGPGL
ncbi:hypothetical protein ACHAPX_005938 [Trichoderma viride]|jgi:NADPH:quinone reductase-like Zn-dependent oxidoreductase